MTAPASHSMESVVIAKVTRRLIPFMFLLYVVAYLDRINVSFAALQMKKELAFSDTVYGLGAGIFFVGYFLFEVPSNLIMARVGARVWIARLVISWGVVSSCMILVKTPASFYLVRFLLGVAEAGFFPGMILYLTYWFPLAMQARSVARFMTAVPLAGVVGAPLSGALLSLNRAGGLAGWQWLFLVEGVPAVVLGISALLYLTDRPGQASWLSPEERLWLVNLLDQERREKESRRRFTLLQAFSNPAIWLLSAIYFTLNLCSYGLSLWLPEVIKSLAGGSNLVIGVLAAFPYAAAGIVMVLVGKHSDQTGERRWHIALSAFAGALALAMVAHAHIAFWVVLGLCGAVAGIFAMMGPFWSLPASFLTGTAAAGAIALINSVGNLGGFFGPYLFGLVKHSTASFHAGLLLLGGSLCLSGVLALVPITAKRAEDISASE